MSYSGHPPSSSNQSQTLMLAPWTVFSTKHRHLHCAFLFCDWLMWEALLIQLDDWTRNKVPLILHTWRHDASSVIRIHPLGTMNISTKFHGNPPNSFRDSLVCTNAVDWPKSACQAKKGKGKKTKTKKKPTGDVTSEKFISSEQMTSVPLICESEELPGPLWDSTKVYKAYSPGL